MQSDRLALTHLNSLVVGPLVLSLLLMAGPYPAAAVAPPVLGTHGQKAHSVSSRPSFSVSQRSVAVWVLAGNSGSSGQYRADLFRVGAPTPTRTIYYYMTGTPPSRNLAFSGIATNQNYFFRITSPDGETRQPPSFYLPGWPWWTQSQPTIQF